MKQEVKNFEVIVNALLKNYSNFDLHEVKTLTNVLQSNLEHLSRIDLSQDELVSIKKQIVFLDELTSIMNENISYMIPLQKIKEVHIIQFCFTKIKKIIHDTNNVINAIEKNQKAHQKKSNQYNIEQIFVQSRREDQQTKTNLTYVGFFSDGRPYVRTESLYKSFKEVAEIIYLYHKNHDIKEVIVNSKGLAIGIVDALKVYAQIKVKH